MSTDDLLKLLCSADMNDYSLELLSIADKNMYDFTSVVIYC